MLHLVRADAEGHESFTLGALKKELEKKMAQMRSAAMSILSPLL